MKRTSKPKKKKLESASKTVRQQLPSLPVNINVRDLVRGVMKFEFTVTFFADLDVYGTHRVFQWK